MRGVNCRGEARFGILELSELGESSSEREQGLSATGVFFGEELEGSSKQLAGSSVIA